MARNDRIIPKDVAGINKQSTQAIAKEERLLMYRNIEISDAIISRFNLLNELNWLQWIVLDILQSNNNNINYNGGSKQEGFMNLSGFRVIFHKSEFVAIMRCCMNFTPWRVIKLMERYWLEILYSYLELTH